MSSLISGSTRSGRVKKKKSTVSTDVTPCFYPYDILNSTKLCTREVHHKKKNCMANPRCIFGLGDTNEGIWHKDAKHVFLQRHLGIDLRDQLRKSCASPACRAPVGLKNLGATCYLNALIQCLFHIVPIRNAILNIDTKELIPTTKDMLLDLEYNDRSTRVIDAIQLTFAHLKHSNQSVYNLDIVTGLLGLNTGEQQDLHELSSLLIAKIDSQDTLNLGKKVSTLPSISQLMNGVQKFSLTCQKCHHVSSREETFCELDLAVEGQKSITDSLLNYFHDELLDGDNKYECSMCNSRQDAIRSTEIVKTPSVLFVQLRRNVYDMKTYQKIKLKTAISIPPRLSILNETYRLTAVVYHRGASAYGGHYISEVLNWEDDKWWLCDDSTVLYSPNGPCKLGENNAGCQEEAADLTQDDLVGAEAVKHVGGEDSKDDKRDSKKPRKNVARRKGGSDTLQSLGVDSTSPTSTEKLNSKDVVSALHSNTSTSSGVIETVLQRDCGEGVEGEKEAASLSVLPEDAIKEYEHVNKLNRSKDVYMLLYVKEEVVLQPLPPAPVKCSKSLAMRRKSSAIAKQQCLNRTPEDLWKCNHLLAVKEKNELFSMNLSSYMEGATKVIREIDARQADFKSFAMICDAKELEKLNVEVDLEKYFLVPTLWLRSWITGQAVVSPSGSVKTAGAGADLHSNICDLTDLSEEPSPVPPALSTNCSTKVESPHANFLFAGAICNRPHLCPHSRSYQHRDDSGVHYPNDNTAGDHVPPSAILEHFKVIPYAAYEILMESIRRHNVSSFAEYVDFEFTDSNVRCDMCSSIEMSNKSSLTDLHGKYVELLKLLNGNQSSDENNQSSGCVGAGNCDSALSGDINSSGRYFIEKRWITSLKKRTDLLQKELNGKNIQAHKTSIPQFHQPAKATIASMSKPVGTGIEIVFLDGEGDEADGNTDDATMKMKGDAESSILNDSASVLTTDGKGTVVGTTTEPGEDKGEEDGDLPLNQALICPHDRLVPGYHRRVKHISLSVWLAVLDLFPDSLPIYTVESAAEDDGGSVVDGEIKTKCTWMRKRKRLRGPGAVAALIVDDDNDDDEEGGVERQEESSESSSQSLPGARTECQQCMEDTLLQKELLQGEQMVRKVERSGDNRCLNDLARRVTCFSMAPLDTSVTYFLIEGLWLQQWRAYTLDTHGVVERPPMLTNASLKCSHGGVNLPKMLLDKLQSSSNDLFSVDTLSYNMSKNVDVFLPEEAPICELVTEQQWAALENLGYHQGKASDSLVEVYCASMPASVTFTRTRHRRCSGLGSDSGTVGSTIIAEEGGSNSVWKCFPEQCASCSSTIHEQKTLHRTYFQNKPIQVVELASHDALTALLSCNADEIPLLAATRSTRVSRTNKRGGKQQLEVSSDDVLALLVLKIYELWPRARPLLQKIYNSSGVLLEGCHKTLEALGVMANCTLYVIVNDEAASLSPSDKTKQSRAKAPSSSSSKKRTRGGRKSNAGEEKDHEDAEENTVDDGGEAEMWQIVSIHASGGYDHVEDSGGGGNGSGSGGGGGGNFTGEVENESNNSKKKASEDGFMGTFLMSG